MTSVDDFVAHGPPMTVALARVLSDLSPSQRRSATAALFVAGRESKGSLGPLLLGLALEVQLAGLRQQAAWQAAVDELSSDDGDQPPLPTATGTASLFVDPDEHGDVIDISQ